MTTVNPPNPDQRVDDLRQRLRSLGYLDAGVDRFVLASAQRMRRPAIIALLASVRIGALAAALLGPAAAIGLAARLPGLVTGPRDAAVVALYLGILFGASVAAAAFAVTSLASWLTRRTVGTRTTRARPLSIGAGILVSAASLGYLTLWWRTADGGLGSPAAGTAFALAVATGISVLLGHAVTVTALAVIAANTDRLADAPRLTRSWRTTAIGGLLAFAGSVVLLVLTAYAGAPDRGDAPPLTVVPSGLRVRLIAIDGVDASLLLRLSAAGRVPAIGVVLNGARAVVQAEDASDPARTWTTIATGQPPEVHGVHGVETRRVAGLQGAVAAAQASALGRAMRGATDLIRLTRPAAASGTERRAKTLWEVAAGAGLRTAVVNWWATWPARPNDGIVLSDRAVLRLERGGELNGEIAPVTAYEPLLKQWPRITSAVREQTEAVGESTSPEIRDVLRRSAELDALQLALTRAISSAELDLRCTYLPGLDVAQFALLGPVPGAPPPASTVAARLSAVEGYYSFLDGLLRDLLKPEAGELVVFVTGPGRVGAGASGLLALHGASAGTVAASRARATDIMPTVLYALGLPTSRELTGRPVLALFSEDFAQRYPVREVATYGRPAALTAPRAGKPLDQEMIDRLRSLGYLR